MFKCLAFQALHDYERLVSLLTDVVNRADVRMIQGGSSTGFPTEAFKCLGGFRKVVRKKFQGNSAAKFRVLGLVHNAHSTAAELLHDAVMRDGLSDEGLGLRHLARILGCRAEASQRTDTNRRGFPATRFGQSVIFRLHDMGYRNPSLLFFVGSRMRSSELT